jgi:hypothetical protein
VLSIALGNMYSIVCSLDTSVIRMLELSFGHKGVLKKEDAIYRTNLRVRDFLKE